MKMKKMVGALALTAALAMGTAPAFAASVSNETNEFDNTEAGSTEVVAKVKKDLNTHIKATVPLQLTVTFGSTGATEIVGPTAAAYKIQNTGSDPIKVKDVEIAEMDSFFTSAAIRQASGIWKYLDVATNKDVNITSGNYLMFTYTTAGNNTLLTQDHSLAAADERNDGYYVTGATDFMEETIPAGNDKFLGITLAGKAYFTDTISNDNVTDTLCKIKYTIGA